MPRPTKNRIVNTPPAFADFKPCGVRSKDLEKLNLTIDEYEAIRLADFEGLDHEEASKRMDISRPTFSRLIEKSRNKIAIFLIEGKHLKIDGGKVHFKQNLFRCNSCGKISKECIKKEIKNCPKCKSENISDKASEMGHGKCCEIINNK